MCLLESCCCCFSLTVGMHLICLGNLVLFSFLGLFGYDQYRHDINVIEWWVYGGLFASICCWIGLRWEKKCFVSVMFIYDVCVAAARAGLLYMHYYHPRNMNLIRNENDANTYLMFLIWNLYFLWVELSYLQQDRAPANVFHPVPQNVIVTEVRRETFDAVPVVPAYPANEYQRQLPYAAPSTYVQVPANVNIPSYVPQHSAVYPPNYPQLYPTAVDHSMANANAPFQPFPYDAPPPYSESKQPPPSVVPSSE